MTAQLAQKQKIPGKEAISSRISTRQLGGYAAIAGAVTMVIGAALWGK